MKRAHANSSVSGCTHTVQEQGDPNSGNDISRARESCNPKTRQGVKRLLLELSGQSAPVDAPWEGGGEGA